MTRPEPNITLKVDLTNPGQYFACCGLLELVDRLGPGAEGWFEGGDFCVRCVMTLTELLKRVSANELQQIDLKDDVASPMRLPAPFNLTLAWWTEDVTQGRQLKVWAGSMRSVRIARAMQRAITRVTDPERLLDHAAVVYDPENPRKKVEPFYFDSRRGWNAQSIDIGFAPDSLKMTTAAYPAVEFLCLVGLQRFRPAPTEQRRQFNYYAWALPLPVDVAAAAASGTVANVRSVAYRFENAFRTAQKKHKSFLPATPIGVHA